MDTSLAYATTPLALASLAIIVGVGILKLLVSGKDNPLNRLITHYGFIVVIIFGIFGNVTYFINQARSSESIVLGNVIEAGSNMPLARAVIDAGPHSRGMTGDSGDFVLAIPDSRKQPSYTVRAVLPGYQPSAKTVEHSPRMSVTIEMKKNEWINVLTFGEADAVIGHFLGLPEVYVPLKVSNPGTTPITLSNFSLRVTAPSGNTRQLYLGSTAPSMAGPIGVPIPSVQVRGQESASWVHGFLQQDQRVLSLSNRAFKDLQKWPAYQQMGAQVGARYLTAQVNRELQSALEQNWFWEPGTSLIKLVCNDEMGRRYEANGKVTLTEKQVGAMKNIRDYYESGYGVLAGTQLIPVGTAQPSHMVKLNPG